MRRLILSCALLILGMPCRADDKPSALELVRSLEEVIGDAIDRAKPSVVAINRIKTEDGRTRAVAHPGATLLPGPLPLPSALGTLDPLSANYVAYDYASGVVVGENGRILTTYHAVVGAARLIVRAPGIPPFDAEVIAGDPRSDLAVIAPALELPPRPDGKPALPPLPLGFAGKLRQGSFLIALGNPFNLARDGEASASWGILANRARSLIPESPSSMKQRLQNFSTLLQLDSKLNLGMSGGAVVNLSGELVAITTASADALGYDPRAGYAIPLDSLGRRALDSLIQGKEVEYGFIGIRLDNQENVVGEVEPGTPAGEGGVVVNDRIISVNGMPVHDFDSLTIAVNSSPVGREVPLVLVREGVELTKSVVLSKFRVEGEIIATNRPEAWRGVRVDFSSIVSSDTDRTLNAMARGRVGVVEVEPGSPSDAVGLEPGLIIVGVQGQRIRSPQEFRDIVAGLGDQPVELAVLSSSAREPTTVTVPPSSGAVDDD
jgi:S1-C subfamily serine protease